MVGSKRTAEANKPVVTGGEHVGKRFYNARTIWVLLTFSPWVALALSSASVAVKEPIKSFAECSS